MEGFGVFDKLDRRCSCVARESRWSALEDTTGQDCSALRFKVDNVLL